MVQQTARPAAPVMIDHWAWRPDWRVERPCLLWYLTFEEQPALAELAHRLQLRLAGLDALDLIPLPWLHLTLDEVGFVDALAAEETDRVVKATGAALKDWTPAPVELGPVTTMEDAVVLQATSAADLGRLRHRLRTVTSTVLGEDRLGADHPPFWAHVSLGYSNRDCAGDDVMARLGAVGGERTSVAVPRLTLASVTRRDRHYQWTVRASLPLGATRS